MERDRFFTAEQAVEYGLVDRGAREPLTDQVGAAAACPR